MRRRAILMASVLLASSPAFAGDPVLARGKHVYGPSATTVTLTGAKGSPSRSLAFSDLAKTPLEPATYEVTFTLPAGDAVELPPCSGHSRTRGTVAGKRVDFPSEGPLVVPVAKSSREGGVQHEDKASSAIDVSLTFTVSSYERRIACGYAPRSGPPQETSEELRELSFASPNAGACHGPCTPGKAIVFVPRGHDAQKPSAVLLGVHPWNGSIWTYAAYQELLTAAQERDVVLLFPSALGNSLYTAPAETETLLALAALERTMVIDPRRVSIWGASMGGAGATTIGFHHPDLFASITSYFGDAKYDVAGYVRGILPTEADAHRVNPLDVVENARHTPVWLIHGERDKTSPIRQSELLYAALSERGYSVRFDRDKTAGHDGALVVKHIADVVKLAESARSPASPARVSLKLVRETDRGAYGIELVRTNPKLDALVDLERGRDGKIRIFALTNVSKLRISQASLGGSADTSTLSADFKGTPIPVEWVR